MARAKLALKPTAGSGQLDDTSCIASDASRLSRGVGQPHRRFAGGEVGGRIKYYLSGMISAMRVFIASPKTIPPITEESATNSFRASSKPNDAA